MSWGKKKLEMKSKSAGASSRNFIWTHSQVWYRPWSSAKSGRFFNWPESGTRCHEQENTLPLRVHTSEGFAVHRVKACSGYSLGESRVPRADRAEVIYDKPFPNHQVSSETRGAT